MTNDVRSSLEVEMLGELPSGMPVAMDKYAYDADAFVVVNRVKPHTEFTYPFESGLMKMMAIGMSKEFGTSTLAGSESEHARIPMVLPNDREAVDAAIATIGPVDSDSLRLVHITNTKDLATLEVSTALLAECAERDDLTVIGEPFPLSSWTTG